MRNHFSPRQLFSLTALTVMVVGVAALSGCADLSGQKQADEAKKAKDLADKNRAKEILEQKLKARQWAEEKKSAALSWAQQKAAENAELQANKAAYDAEYPPHRLAAVAKWTTWAPINLPDAGIDARLRSNWTNGGVNIRLVLMGQEQAINAFCGWKRFIVMFQDGPGANLTPFSVSPQEFKWADPARNNGVPTLELEKHVPYPIEEYERSAQWNLMWSGE